MPAVVRSMPVVRAAQLAVVRAYKDAYLSALTTASML
jgi:hypothetical protein